MAPRTLVHSKGKLMKAHLIVASCILFVSAVRAQTWTETGEAGNLPGTAQSPIGAGTLSQIDGNINDPAEPMGAGNDRDMYVIFVDNPAAFVATTVGGSTLDTQLFLFHTTGIGVTFSDDSGVSTQSRLTGMFVPSPGLYLLAVARFDRDATGLGAEIWADTPFNTERAPDGPGAANPVDGWNGLGVTGITGAYSIFLTGVSFPVTCPTASATGYGTGAGSIHGVPDLSTSGTPSIGSMVQLQVDNPSPSSGQGYLIIGLGRASLPFFNGTILVDNIYVILSRGVIPPGVSTVLTADLSSPSLCSPITTNFQLLILEFAGVTTRHGFVLSDGEEWVIGS
jgi:hypothetical protein